eukprot:TRINITY_DN19254_c0_g1_i1.p1 TRINITY_DN19254_c0_g1~~TRINITY_DN19254_c0_g1_i1.p1  ORF type:complete len:536 (-),score=99.21 TRINITY_DN19254_c0_g1_i1:602-2188(-)
MAASLSMGAVGLTQGLETSKMLALSSLDSTKSSHRIVPCHQGLRLCGSLSACTSRSNRSLFPFKLQATNAADSVAAPSAEALVHESNALAAEAGAALAASSQEVRAANGHSPDGGRSETEILIEKESRLFVGTYARAPVVFVRGEGCKLYDTEGREYIDMAAGIAVNALGHGDPEWVQAVTEQALKLAHVSNLYHSVPQIKLAESLVSTSFADRIFFTNSGTEANEAAIKFARKYQREKAKGQEKGSWLQLGPSEPATEFISFSNCFHGRTMGALALTSKQQYRDPFEPLMPGGKFATYGDLESVTKLVRKGRTAAVFVEPVQGEGGIYAATAEFLRGLRRLCDDNDVLLVFDEVQCGLGRTGRLWAHEVYGVTPDIMTVAKPLAGGLPIGAVLVTQAVASAISPGDHGSTFAGGPLVCHAALSVMDRVTKPGFLQSVAAKGDRLKRSLEERLGTSSHVKEVRGVGLLVGIQLDVPAGPLVTAARDAGLLVITAGKGDVVRLVPPLTISDEELDIAVDILSKCLPVLG